MEFFLTTVLKLLPFLRVTILIAFTSMALGLIFGTLSVSYTHLDVYKRQSYKIDADKCKGCTLCARNCPNGAISGKLKEPHVIDQSKCLKCGACMEKCRFGAIYKE